MALTKGLRILRSKAPERRITTEAITEIYFRKL